MDQQEIIAGFEGRAARLGVSIGYVCEQAGIHRTSFSRWKKSEGNPDPVGMRLASMNAIGSTLDKFERQSERPQTGAAA